MSTDSSPNQYYANCHDEVCNTTLEDLLRELHSYNEELKNDHDESAGYEEKSSPESEENDEINKESPRQYSKANLEEFVNRLNEIKAKVEPLINKTEQQPQSAWDQLRDQLDKQRNQLVHQRDQLEQYKMHLAKKDEQISSLKECIAGFEDDISKLKEDSSKQDAKVASSINKAEEQPQFAWDQMKDQLDELKNQLLQQREQYEIDLGKKDEEISSLKRYITEIKGENLKLKEECSNQDEELEGDRLGPLIDDIKPRVHFTLNPDELDLPASNSSFSRPSLATVVSERRNNKMSVRDMARAFSLDKK